MHRHVLGLTACVVLVPVAASDLTVVRFETPYTRLETDANGLVGIDARNGRFRIAPRNGGLTHSAIPGPEPLEPVPDDILPDGEVALGTGMIRRAWLGGATHRYDHGVLGDAVEASVLWVERDDGVRLSFRLADDLVFEDRFPRIADVDMDGSPELVVIRTSIRAGAGIAVYGIAENRLELEAASDFIGQPHRWMNIAGIDDYDGDGQTEIAVVRTPHIGGTLMLLRQSGGRLEPVLSQFGFSNHAHGSRELRLSASLDVDGDGITDLALPDTSRRALVLVAVDGGRYQELARISETTRIESAIHVAPSWTEGQPALAYLLRDGSLTIVRWH